MNELKIFQIVNFRKITLLIKKTIREFAIDIDSRLEGLILNPIVKNTVKYCWFTSLKEHFCNFNNNKLLKSNFFNQQN